MSDPFVQKFLDLLVKDYGCHTIILYGSRSRGTETAESDYDLIGFSDTGVESRVADWIDGQFIDAFVYRSESLHGREHEFLRIKGGLCLSDRDGQGRSLLERVEKIFSAGPSRLSESEIHLQRVWVLKMLGRAGRQDIEGNFRRVWLQHDLLEMYFSLRGLWYLGPKEAFVWLSANDGIGLELFEESLADPGCLRKLESLAQHVTRDVNASAEA